MGYLGSLPRPHHKVITLGLESTQSGLTGYAIREFSPTPPFVMPNNILDPAVHLVILPRRMNKPLKRFLVEWSCMTTVYPDLEIGNPDLPHKVTDRVGLAKCGGQLYMFAHSAGEAITLFKRNPRNKLARATAVPA